jgi:hypothetical protein
MNKKYDNNNIIIASRAYFLHYQPTTDGREGWHAQIAELVAIANEDPALGGA